MIAQRHGQDIFVVVQWLERADFVPDGVDVFAGWDFERLTHLGTGLSIDHNGSGLHPRPLGLLRMTWARRASSSSGRRI